MTPQGTSNPTPLYVYIHIYISGIYGPYLPTIEEPRCLVYPTYAPYLPPIPSPYKPAKFRQLPASLPRGLGSCWSTSPSLLRSKFLIICTTGWLSWSSDRLFVYIYICIATAPKVPLIRVMWSLLGGVWGVLERSWGVLVYLPQK